MMASLVVTLLLFAFAATTVCEASHFRYASMTWSRTDPKSKQVSAVITTAWRRSFSDWKFTVDKFGQRQFLSTAKSLIDWGDGTYQEDVPFVVKSENTQVVTDAANCGLTEPNSDWVIATQTVSHLYLSAGIYTVSLYKDTFNAKNNPNDRCCRVADHVWTTMVKDNECRTGMKKAPTVKFFVNAQIDLYSDMVISPVITLMPVVTVAVGQKNSFQLKPGSYKDKLLFSFVDNKASGIEDPRPAGLFLSPAGLLEWTPPAGTQLGLYATQIRVDIPGTGATPSKNMIPVDFLFDVRDAASLPPPPALVSSPSSFVSLIGADSLRGVSSADGGSIQWEFEIKAVCADGSEQNVGLIHSALPSGATMSACAEGMWEGEELAAGGGDFSTSTSCTRTFKWTVPASYQETVPIWWVTVQKNGLQSKSLVKMLLPALLQADLDIYAGVSGAAAVLPQDAFINPGSQDDSTQDMSVGTAFRDDSSQAGFTLVNSGNAPLIISDLSLAGEQRQHFAVKLGPDSPLPLTIPPKGRAPFFLRFKFDPASGIVLSGNEDRPFRAIVTVQSNVAVADKRPYQFGVRAMMRAGSSAQKARSCQFVDDCTGAQGDIEIGLCKGSKQIRCCTTSSSVVVTKTAPKATTDFPDDVQWVGTNCKDSASLGTQQGLMDFTCPHETLPVATRCCPVKQCQACKLFCLYSESWFDEVQQCFNECIHQPESPKASCLANFDPRFRKGCAFSLGFMASRTALTVKQNTDNKLNACAAFCDTAFPVSFPPSPSTSRNLIEAEVCKKLCPRAAGHWDSHTADFCSMEEVERRSNSLGKRTACSFLAGYETATANHCGAVASLSLADQCRVNKQIVFGNI